MALILEQITLPSHYAPALINGEYDGLSDADTAALNTALARAGLSFSHCVDCEDAGFLRWHDAPDVGAADCMVFTFQK